MIVRAATATDAATVAAIYAHYVRDSAVTFEEAAPDTDEMARRMAEVRAPCPWLVAEADGVVAGYAYAKPYHARAAYRWTCETTIYLAPARRGGGIGRALYAALLERLAAAGFVAAVAAITVPNAESVRFHEAAGFRAAGRLAGIGWKHGRWHDVGFWQRDLAARGAAPREPGPGESGGSGRL